MAATRTNTGRWVAFLPAAEICCGQVVVFPDNKPRTVYGVKKINGGVLLMGTKFKAFGRPGNRATVTVQREDIIPVVGFEFQ